MATVTESYIDASSEYEVRHLLQWNSLPATLLTDIRIRLSPLSDGENVTQVI